MAIKLATGKEFFKDIINRAKQGRNPFSIMFELTYKCNFRCPHCYLSGTPEESRELNKNQIFSILDQLKDLQVYHIGFTGGEALLREDIFDILDYTNRCGFRFTLLTNGYLIDEKVADRLKKNNVNKITITFNSITPQGFSRITQVEDSFQKVKGAIEILRRKDIQVKIRSTSMKLNSDELVKISQYARSLNIPYSIDEEVLPSRNGCDIWASKYSLTNKELYEIKKTVYPEMFRNEWEKEQVKSKRKIDRMFNCGVGMTFFSITPYGKMNFCNEINYPGYDILAEGVSVCWEKLKKEIDNFNNIEDFICRECELLKYCDWCPGRSYIETGTFNNCSEYFKNMAIEKKTQMSTAEDTDKHAD
ncbi:MAG: hypothetical protein A2042_07165 [Candidatus Schekmanbacteria bacterium GWA2_38_11]|uniref:Radical SAM core domain-containing protein n=1 Tax=Candidatus Schekmanbacteria bacterium GWA2_38_11 TaxID=1817876 RepID=A0A1F7RCV6_9BACT|nr:MAG: hypothetical protein A2042_07165 [Candidatus Schekmanbacteria bacterium GWA2_38_11]